MKRRIVLCLSLAVAMLTASLAVARDAKSKTKPEDVGKAGVLYAMPPGLPVEKRGGGVFLDLGDGNQYFLTVHHVQNGPELYSVEPIDGKWRVATASRVWPKDAKPLDLRKERDLALFRLDKPTSKTPFTIADLLVPQDDSLFDSILLGGVPNGNVASEPVKLPRAKKINRAYWVFAKDLIPGMSGAPAIKNINGHSFLDGIVFANGEVKDEKSGKKVEGGVAYTAPAILGFIDDYLRSRGTSAEEIYRAQQKQK